MPVQVYKGDGVIYAKINKVDVNGNNNSLSLQELTKLRFSFLDNAPEYSITSIAEFNDYYLYSISRNPQTSSLSDNVLNYRFSASAYTTSSLPIPYDVGANVLTGSYWNTNVDSLGYFSNGVYTFGNTPNVTIAYTASVTSTPVTTANFLLYLIKNNTLIESSSTAGIAGTPVTLTITGSIKPLENDRYYIAINSTGDITASNAIFKITQSIASASSDTNTIFDPYLTSVFRNSDFDVLMNNAEEIELNNNFMRVIYNDGELIPSNQIQILSGSAELADVKDYNYRLLAQTTPRYQGVKLEGQEINKWNQGDISYGKEPVVNLQGTYFSYFDYMIGTNDVLINKKLAHILYLIDKDGNVQTPTLKAPYYYNLIQNYENQNNRADISFTTSSGSKSNIQGLRKVIRAGVYPKPIIYSQTGSTSNSSSVILFDNIYTPQLVINDYRTVVSYAAFSTVLPYFNVLDQTSASETIGSPYTTSSLSTTDSNIEINSTTNKTNIILTLNLNNIYCNFNGLGGSKKMIFRIIKWDGSAWNTIHTETKDVYKTPSTFSISSPPQTITNGDKYRVTIDTGGATSISLGASSFAISQTPPPTALSVSLPYWTTGSTPSNVITGSAFDTVFVPENPLYQTSPLGTGSNIQGYDSVLPFTIEVNDEIRFNGDETQTYKIMDVGSYPNGRGTLYLTLDRNLNPGTNINSFLIRRFTLDPNTIVLDIPAAGGGAGFIFTEYTTLDIQNNTDKIIQDLKAKGLIPIQ